MPKLTQARAAAATTSKDQIEPGTPEETYQTINRAKMLWNFRRRDVDSWSEVIDRWASKPEAWNRIPEDSTPYGSPRLMIERELETDYEQFKAFVRIVLGEAYAAKIDEPFDTHGGNRNPWGANGKPDNQSYLDNFDYQDKQRGTSSAYLRQQIEKKDPNVLNEIGKGKQYGTLKAAARELGLVAREIRYSLPDDARAAGRYLAGRVDKEWLLTMVDEFMKRIEE